MCRILTTYSGKVQGVGYRWNVLKIAQSYQVSGYVKNLTSGRVEMLIEGERKEVNKLIFEVEEKLKEFWKTKEVEEKPGLPHYENFRILDY